MIRFNIFTCTWTRKLLVISPCDMLFLAFETDDTQSLLGIVDLLGTSTFVETSTSKKWKFKTEEIVSTKLFFLLRWSVIHFISYINSMQPKKKLLKITFARYRSIDLHYFLYNTFPKFINMKCIMSLLFIWPFEVLLLMLDVDKSCSWVFAVDVRGESYVVTSKKVKLICLVSNFISSYPIPHILFLMLNSFCIPVFVLPFVLTQTLRKRLRFKKNIFQNCCFLIKRHEITFMSCQHYQIV